MKRKGRYLARLPWGVNVSGLYRCAVFGTLGPMARERLLVGVRGMGSGPSIPVGKWAPANRRPRPFLYHIAFSRTR